LYNEDRHGIDLEGTRDMSGFTYTDFAREYVLYIFVRFQCLKVNNCLFLAFSNQLEIKASECAH